MKLKIMSTAVLLVLLSFSVGWAQTDMSISQVDGLHNTDTVLTVTSIRFVFRLINNSTVMDTTFDTLVVEPLEVDTLVDTLAGNITGFTNGFRVYSPTGANWTTSTGAYTGSILPSMIENVFVIPFSIPGADSDTIGFGRFTLFAPVILPEFDDTVWTIEVGPIGNADHCGEI